MSKIRVLLAAFVAMVAMGFAATAANATTAVITPNDGFTASSRSVRMSAGIINITCDVSLTGRLISPVATAPGNQIGTISSGTATNCVGGTASVDTSTAWRLTIAAVLGTLPNFSGVLFNISTVRFTVVVAGQTCIYAGTIGALAPNDAGASASGSISVINMLANSLARQTGSSALCPTTGSLSTPQQFALDARENISIS